MTSHMPRAEIAQEERPVNGGSAPTTGAQSRDVFGLRAAWLHFADQAEIRRLAKLQVRIDRKERALHEMRQERHTIMRRCIRRMRRARGLQ